MRVSHPQRARTRLEAGSNCGGAALVTGVYDIMGNFDCGVRAGVVLAMALASMACGCAGTAESRPGGAAGDSPSSVAGNAGASMGGSEASGGGASAGGATHSTAELGPPQSSAVGYGRDTTGGGTASPIDVESLAAAQAAIDAYSGAGGLVLQYTGVFDFSTITDPCVQHTLPAQILELKNKSDVSLVGKDGSSANFGIHVAGACRNIIIRNMTIGLAPGADYSDLISLEGMSSGIPNNVWIDHNELFTSMVDCPGAGDTAFDGMLDVKKGADNVTVSYNYMHDHQKVSLNGYTDTDDAVRHITFDHNLFENVASRTPLQRHGYSHILNNQFSRITVSGINVRMGGYALVEANYFENVANPVTARDSDSIGYWELRANNLASAADVSAGNPFGIRWTSGNAGTVNATDWTTTAVYPIDLGYVYEAQPYQCIHDGLRLAAGAGKGLVTLECK